MELHLVGLLLTSGLSLSTQKEGNVSSMRLVAMDCAPEMQARSKLT